MNRRKGRDVVIHVDEFDDGLNETMKYFIKQ